MAFKSIFIILYSPALIKRVVQLHICFHCHAKACRCSTYFFCTISTIHLHYHTKMCCTSTKHQRKSRFFVPSLPCESTLMYNLNQWHYRLLKNFNLFTNEESMIPIHLYFRHSCQGL